MKIAVGQTRSEPGEISDNIKRHLELVDSAVTKSADAVFFPELSITGYEPELASAFAFDWDEPRFEVFQAVSDAQNVWIGIGAPIRQMGGITISMLLFQPGRARLVHSKRFLHTDEKPFFQAGEHLPNSVIQNTNVALAICYEISIPEHTEAVCTAGAQLYVASVAKTRTGVTKALDQLPLIAVEYSIPVLLSNCVGPCEGQQGGGCSAIWDAEGRLLEQLDGTREDVLVLDTEQFPSE